MPTIKETDKWINEINQNYDTMIERTIEYLNNNNINQHENIRLTYNTPRSCYVKEVINGVEQEPFGIVEFDVQLHIIKFTNLY